MTNTDIDTERFARLVKRGELERSDYAQETLRQWLIEWRGLATDEEILFLATRGLRPDSRFTSFDVVSAFRAATLHASGVDVGLGREK